MSIGSEYHNGSAGMDKFWTGRTKRHILPSHCTAPSLTLSAYGINYGNVQLLPNSSIYRKSSSSSPSSATLLPSGTWSFFMSRRYWKYSLGDAAMEHQLQQRLTSLSMLRSTPSLSTFWNCSSSPLSHPPISWRQALASSVNSNSAHCLQ